MKQNVAFSFIFVSLLCLVAGVFFGVSGGLQYILPEFLRDLISFNKVRPLHVTLVITWIFAAATGGIYYYLPKLTNRKLYSVSLVRLHLYLFIVTGSIILICYLAGYFGGREYVEFPPILGIPLIICWILFLVNFFRTLPIRIAFRKQSKALFKKLGGGSIYHWMWSTGIIFFLLTISESYLWQLPFFRDNIVRDMTVQWKALGAMVGSWNMLVYGTSFCVMEKISGDNKISKSPITFFFYFLGLVNLMFNWGHHTYIVPSSPWIRNVAYIISMTELLILGNIIYNWRKSLNKARKNFHLIPYRLISAADVWIFLNLTLAIFISVPGVNYYTHGTHITVAHAMGATIGINTMLLLSSLYFISETEFPNLNSHSRRIIAGFWITNISFFAFWVSMLGSGFVKALEREKGSIFQSVMEKLSPWFHAFAISGFGVFIGIVLMSFPLLELFKNSLNSKPVETEVTLSR